MPSLPPTTVSEPTVRVQLQHASPGDRQRARFSLDGWLRASPTGPGQDSATPVVEEYGKGQAEPTRRSHARRAD
eukprot:12916206-Prorocentrum_lima.AAC.1